MLGPIGLAREGPTTIYIFSCQAIIVYPHLMKKQHKTVVILMMMMKASVE